MKEKTVLIFGSGHLAYRVKKLLNTNDYNVVHITIEALNSTPQDRSLLESFNKYIKEIDLASVMMVYLLDDRDEYNLQLIIALISLNVDISITASLFNENLTTHLRATLKHLNILNPAKIAAPVFVAALHEPITRHLQDTPKKNEREIPEKKGDKLIQKLIIAFAALLLSAIIFFHISENYHGWTRFTL
ncbi:MAG: hypothetical protein JWQ09_5349 [Segetibacter sp.]|nr:hypothetical protein [Segetibacter sp.]